MPQNVVISSKVYLYIAMASVHRQWDTNVNCIACMHKSLHYNHVFTQPLKLKDVANIYTGYRQ